jgi:hypothetical protein
MVHLVLTLKRSDDGESIQVPLLLLTVPPANTARKADLGRWHCGSPYIGNNILGGFEISYGGRCNPPGYYEPKRKVRLNPKEPTRIIGGRWISCNPSGYFFDHYIEVTSPTTTVEHVYPFLELNELVLAPGRMGGGKLHRHYVAGIRSELGWEVQSIS